jgi:hypothetical protein
MSSIFEESEQGEKSGQATITLVRVNDLSQDNSSDRASQSKRVLRLEQKEKQKPLAEVELAASVSEDRRLEAEGIFTLEPLRNRLTVFQCGAEFDLAGGVNRTLVQTERKSFENFH